MMPGTQRETAPPFAADDGGRVLRRPHGEGREALIRAVIRVVARRGLSGLSYRAVAKEAGVTHGLVHYHFGSRDGMLLETLRWVVEFAAADLLIPEAAAAGEAPARDFPLGLADLSDDDREAHLFVNEVVLAACRNDAMHEVIAPTFDYVFDAMSRILETAGIEATPARARLVFAAISGLTVQHLFFRSREATLAAAEELRELLAAMRAAHPARPAS